MSEKQYASAVGFVQFDPEQKVVSVNGDDKSLLNFSVRAVGFTGQPLVQVTLWDEWADAFGVIANGSFVAVDGQYKQNSKDGRVYHNITASKLFVDGVLIERAERTDGGTRVPATSSTEPAF